MSNFSTELMCAFLKGARIEEVIRLELEKCVNELLRL